jgi:4-hydroxybenzoate polyprenyltransferase
MATPGLAAALWLGDLPHPMVVALGIVTAFAGYTAVYALNDIVDYRADREKVRGDGLTPAQRDLDAVFVRHPMAQGLLSFRDGLVWTGGWALLALLGAYLLNPVCALIFLTGCLLEAVYCLLLRITHLRVVVSGIVKTSGGMAAVFAVDPSPSPVFLGALFLWLFFWEIGGQNVPNDWTDLDEDRRLRARTLPARLGRRSAGRVILLSLGLAVALSLGVYWVTPAPLGPVYPAGALVVGVFFLWIPAFRLIRSGGAEQASALFNRASYYPLAMLGVVVLSALTS